MSNSDYERLLFADTGTIGPHSCVGGIAASLAGGFLFSWISPVPVCRSTRMLFFPRRGPYRMPESSGGRLRSGAGRRRYAALVSGHYVGLASSVCSRRTVAAGPSTLPRAGLSPVTGCGMVRAEASGRCIRGRRSHLRRDSGNGPQSGRENQCFDRAHGLAQQAVIRSALQNAKVRASDISYVENAWHGHGIGRSHRGGGSGEAMGAPSAEALPLRARGRQDQLGHLEAAAGIAGLMKTALALEHQEIPKNLHFEKLNSHISLKEHGSICRLRIRPGAWQRSALAALVRSA